MLHHASEVVLADVVNLRLRRRWRLLLLLLHRHLPSSGTAGNATGNASGGGHGRRVGEGGLVEGALADALSELVDAQVVAGPTPLHAQM